MADSTTYNVPSSSVFYTNKGIKVPVGRNGMFPVVDHIILPKSQVQERHVRRGITELTIPNWILKDKRDKGELLPGYDIIDSY